MQRYIGLFFIFVMLVGCGKKGPLIYPEMTAPAAPVPVTARQAGQSVRISIALPQKDQAGRGLANLGGISVFKRGVPLGQGPGCPACTEGFVLFRKLYLDLPPVESMQQRFGSLLVLMDSEVRIGEEYSYTVTPFTRDSQEGLSSPQVSAAMVPPPQPPKLKALSQPTEVRLTFDSLAPQKGTLVGYNLYRAQKGETLPFLPLNKELVTGKSYVDTGLDRNLNYIYAARAVVRLPTGTLVESDLSNEESAHLTDE